MVESERVKENFTKVKCGLLSKVKGLGASERCKGSKEQFRFAVKEDTIVCHNI